MESVPNGSLVGLEALDEYVMSVTPNCYEPYITLYDNRGAVNSGDEVLIRFTK